MKNSYIALFLLILIIISFLGLYFIDIPSPSTTVSEEHNLEIT